MPSPRAALNAGLAVLLRDEIADCLVLEDADVPNDWESIAETRVLIVRGGGFTRRVITGCITWTHQPTIEGHVRADKAEDLADPSDALLTEVIALLDADDTLGGLCDAIALGMEEAPDINTTQPASGSAMAWALQLEVEIEERTES